MVESSNIESRLSRLENLQLFSPDFVVQAVQTMYLLCSPGYFVCEIADLRVQAMSSFRLDAFVVQARRSHYCCSLG
jgi:hypothetical protein